RITAELRLAEVCLDQLLKWKRRLRMLCKKGPDFEHIHTLGAVDEVQRRIVAKRYAHQTLAIEYGPLRMALEKFVAFPFLNACQPAEVGLGDAFERAFFTHENAGSKPADADEVIVRVSAGPRWQLATLSQHA